MEDFQTPLERNLVRIYLHVLWKVYTDLVGSKQNSVFYWDFSGFEINESSSAELGLVVVMHAAS